MEETGLHPEGASYRFCLDFASILIMMEDEAKKASISVRHCLNYAESKAEEGHTISHATFYNDEILNAMLHWATDKAKSGKVLGDNPKSVKKLEEQVQKLKHQMQSLVKKAQQVDYLIIDLQEAKESEMRNWILLNRAFNLLQVNGLLPQLNQVVSDEEIMSNIHSSHLYYAETEVISSSLEQDSRSNIDEQ